MDFEIDVSGGDLLNKDYTIVISNKGGEIKGFKFNENLVQVLNSRYGEGRYRYAKSKTGKSFLKIRIYCVVIYYLIKSCKIKDKTLNLDICRDFQGHEKEITSHLNYFLGKLLGYKININYKRLPQDSNADKYAYLMRKDKKNLVKGYVKISLEDIEIFIRKK